MSFQFFCRRVLLCSKASITMFKSKQKALYGIHIRGSTGIAKLAVRSTEI